MKHMTSGIARRYAALREITRVITRAITRNFERNLSTSDERLSKHIIQHFLSLACQNLLVKFTKFLLSA